MICDPNHFQKESALFIKHLWSKMLSWKIFFNQIIKRQLNFIICTRVLNWKIKLYCSRNINDSGILLLRNFYFISNIHHLVLAQYSFHSKSICIFFAKKVITLGNCWCITVSRDWASVSNFEISNRFEKDIFNTIRYPFPMNSATFIKIKLYFPFLLLCPTCFFYNFPNLTHIFII